MSQIELSPDVLKVISEGARAVGRWQEEMFSQQLFCGCSEEKMESPIEQILYCALETIREVNDIRSSGPYEIGDKTVIRGLGIWPQIKIGNYRIDFRVDNEGPNLSKEVFVECDSQQFHERTERERRYEKARDRFLTHNGYTIFHYTGKEIMENPYGIACEIIAFVTGLKKEDLCETFLEYK